MHTRCCFSTSRSRLTKSNYTGIIHFILWTKYTEILISPNISCFSLFSEQKPHIKKLL